MLVLDKLRTKIGIINNGLNGLYIRKFAGILSVERSEQLKECENKKKNLVKMLHVKAQGQTRKHKTTNETFPTFPNVSIPGSNLSTPTSLKLLGTKKMKWYN
ncbi:hypothetical protein HELRODRAFT_182589 [Helobdella robusta]|uniref:Uncharacterized protein n=1 Tax=Helobdella robusta TaxID=6412 RepID=T1FIF2_HELRO|nr:hypothetical protein HELRODRAFT_182589 [Helobdella robusta]ESN90880.1 hypothetical protein HELRODRAFT_182589 [Helobdella robusta]